MKKILIIMLCCALLLSATGCNSGTTASTKTSDGTADDAGSTSTEAGSANTKADGASKNSGGTDAASDSTNTEAGGAAKNSSETGAVSDSSTSTELPEKLNADDMFTDRDKETGYDESTSTLITLDKTLAQCEDSSVIIDGSTVTISEEGTYILTGVLDNGQIIIDTKDTAKVQLVLNNVSINCDTSAAIYVRQADKVFITLAPDSTNTLSNTSEFIAIDDNNIDAVIFSKDDLTFNGSGTLTVQAAFGHGIVSKDDLVITGGTYVIDAASHGLSGKDSIRILDGTLTVTSGKDGAHAENAEDTSLGFIYIAGGSFTINALTDGFDAGNILQIDGGVFNITSGGGSNADLTSQDISAKGLKAAAGLLIYNGTFTIDAFDDALHSNGSIVIENGTFQLATGDDGMHADAALIINDGTINISKSYEGLEGLTIDINGGTITLTASDDGLNAAGGSDQSNANGRMGADMFAVTEDAYIRITGGVITIDASGDGIDSNGHLYITGGETYVNGPTSGADGALDYDGTATISGGILVAAGSSGMAQNLSSAENQGAILVNTTQYQTAGSTITLSDADGNTLLTFSPQKQYNSVVISCPGIKEGETYELTMGSETASVTMESLIYGTGGMGGGMRGGMDNGMGGGAGKPGNSSGGGMRGGMQAPGDGMAAPDGDMQTPSDGMAAPDGNMQAPGDGMEAPSDGMQVPGNGTSVPSDDESASVV